jgi:hypothetical protein
LCRFGLFLPFSCRSEKSPINLKDAKEKYTSHRRFLPFGDRLTQQYTLTPPLKKKIFPPHTFAAPQPFAFSPIVRLFV